MSRLTLMVALLLCMGSLSSCCVLSTADRTLGGGTARPEKLQVRLRLIQWNGHFPSRRTPLSVSWRVFVALSVGKKLWTSPVGRSEFRCVPKRRRGRPRRLFLIAEPIALDEGRASQVRPRRPA
eukprot:35051-Amphidinium_carterae.1